MTLPNDFNEITMEYTDSILKSIGLDLTKPIVLDQPFAGNNPQKSLKYYRDSKAIIVDRDPRDLYLLAKVYFPKTSYQVPYENVNDFIEYYRSMHNNMKSSLDNPNVLYIKFEELVYQYENAVEKIISFTGLSNHSCPKSYFVPEQSMVNTRLFSKNNSYSEDIMLIEKELNDYLFDFDSYKDKFSHQDDSIGMFDESPQGKKYRWGK